MTHDTPLITTIALGLVGAFVLGLLAKRLNLPPIVGYLAAGILIGPYTPGFVGDQEIATELSELGVILLMFGVGLHFNYRDLIAVARIAVPGAIGQMVAATALGFGMGQLLGWTPAASILFGLALSVASTVVLLRALEERQLLDTKSGHVAVGWLIVEDIAIVLALVMVPVLATGVAGSTVEGASAGGGGAVALSLLWTIVRVGIFVALMFIVGRRVIPWLLGKVAATGSRELFTLGVLGIGLGVAVGAAALFDISFALGAFFAGMILKESELSQRAAEDSLPLRDAFAVLFFVSVGMLVDPSVVVKHPLAVIATVLIVVVGKAVAAFVIVKALRKSTTMALIVAASLAQIGEFSFILVSLGRNLEILPQLGADLILSGAILSILLNPVIFALAHRRQKYRERVLEASGKDARIAERIGDDFPHQYSGEGHVIVVGYGRVGRLVAEELWSRYIPTVIIDDDEERVLEIRGEGHEAILGNALRGAALRKGGIEEAAYVVVAIPNGLEAGEIVTKIKERGPNAKVIVRTHHEDEIAYLEARGANRVVMGEREIATVMVHDIIDSEPLPHH